MPSFPGIIQDRRDEVTFTGFYYSVQMLKQIQTQTFELHTPVEYVDKSDNYKLAQASKILINLLSYYQKCLSSLIS